MARGKHLTAGLILALTVSLAASIVTAQAPPPAKGGWIVPIKGTAEIGYTKPSIKMIDNSKTILTTFKVKNLAGGPIALLKIDEYWYDAKGQMIPGDSYRHKKPLMAGEVINVELRTPKQPGMSRNSYQFSHANGAIKPKLLTKIDEPGKTQ